MSVEVKVKGLDGLRKRLKNMSNDLIDPKVLSALTQEIKKDILVRTDKGVDFKGKKFDNYSDSYKKFRAKKGRGSSPDLQFTKRMLGNMTTKVGKDRGKIFFSRAEEAKKAYFHTEKGVGKSRVKREFFRLSKENIRFVKDRLNKHIRGAVRGR